MAKVITTQNFEEEVLKSEKPFLLDFWGNCRRKDFTGCEERSCKDSIDNNTF